MDSRGELVGVIADEIVLPQLRRLLRRVYGNRVKYYRVDEYYLSFVAPFEVTIRMVVSSEDGARRADELFTYLVYSNRRCRLVDIHRFSVKTKIDYSARPDVFRTRAELK